MNTTKELNAALAKFQASLPRIAKDNTANAGTYTYKYAGLDEVAAAIMPALGKVGLAFTAFPSLVEGKLMLVYSLMHESGEERVGVWPLPTGTPQQLGSAITYGRRYCLLAVTGVFPGGEDDDGQAAESAPVNGHRESFDDASPVRPNGHQNGSAANGTVARPPAQTRPEPTGEPDPDAQPFADEAAAALSLDTLKAINVSAREAHKLAALIVNPNTGGKGGLGQFIEWKRKQIQAVDAAYTALVRAAEPSKMSIEDVETHVKKVTGKSVEEASAAELKQATEALTAPKAA